MALLLPILLAATPSLSPVLGTWDARLLPTPGHPVAFGVEIARRKGGLEAWLVNGSIRTPFTSAVWDGRELSLSLAHFDAAIVAHAKDGGLEGRYERTTAQGRVTVPFAASRPPVSAPGTMPARSVAGAWGFRLEQEKDTGVFRQKGSAVEGTLLSTTGDYGPLHGTFDGTGLVLTAFDGVHVYRFDGVLEEDGTLDGEFRSRTNPPVQFRARRLTEKEAAEWIPGGFRIVKAKDPASPFRFAYPDARGKTVSSEDFAGRPMIVTIMGTWCPNCADEAPVLAKLDGKYRGKGLAIVELAFEYTGDVARYRRQASRYEERFGIDFPVLLAGTTDDTPKSAVVAQLEGWEGYPTTLFLDRDHRIVAAYSGFDGPATGERFTTLQREFEEIVRKIVAR